MPPLSAKRGRSSFHRGNSLPSLSSLTQRYADQSERCLEITSSFCQEREVYRRNSLPHLSSLSQRDADLLNSLLSVSPLTHRDSYLRGPLPAPLCHDDKLKWGAKASEA